MAALGLIVLVLIGLGTGLAGLLVGIVLATVPVPLYVLLVLWIDRYEKEPAGMLALAFVWGASVAIFFAYVFNTAAGVAIDSLAGAATAELGTSIVSAPLVEETAKGLALLVLCLWKRDEFDNVTDGIVYAAMVGLGFAMTENVQYYGAALEHGIGGSLSVFIMRGTVAPFSHPLFTALTGIGVGVACETRNRFLQGLAPLTGLAGAIALHALWNLAASFGAMFAVVYVLVMMPALGAVVGLVLYSLHRERRLIREHLAAYVEAGDLTAAELAALGSFGGRWEAQRAAARQAGWRGWRRQGRFHQTASELAFHCWRTTRGISRGPRHDAEAEQALRVCLRALRANRQEE